MDLIGFSRIRGIGEKHLGHLFIISSSSHFFNKLISSTISSMRHLPIVIKSVFHQTGSFTNNKLTVLLQAKLLNYISVASIHQTRGAPKGGGRGVWRSNLHLLKLKKQHNFVDITQFVTPCHIYFLLNNHLSCC